MPEAPAMSSSGNQDAGCSGFYVEVLERLRAARVPFLVGGAFAFTSYTGIERSTKDLDLFIHGDDYHRVRQVLAEAGYETRLAYEHWLAKVHAGDCYLDLIFSSGNGVAAVDDLWFRHAREAELLGVKVLLAPVEETIWSKAFVMERERYDGADVVHLLQAWADRMDWKRLLERFGPHWRVLLSHLVLFGFVYPAQRARIPGWVSDELLVRLRDEQRTEPPADLLCQGTLLSREQYLPDVEQLGQEDARVALGTMTPPQVAVWTDAIPGRPSGP